MSLYLCGGGSGKRIQSILLGFSKKLDKTRPILYVPLAMDESKYDSCYNWFSKEIKLMNLNDFEMVRSSLELSKKDLSNYSAIFIGGGNTFKLLDEIKQYSNFQKIQQYLNNDGIIFGSSAGAIIFGKDIDCCKLDDDNYLSLKNVEGFNCLNDYSIICHLDNENFKNNCKYLEEYSKKHKTIYLPEDDAILIENGKFTLLGSEDYVIFKNGKHYFANIKNDILR